MVLEAVSTSFIQNSASMAMLCESGIKRISEKSECF